MRRETGKLYSMGSTAEKWLGNDVVVKVGRGYRMMLVSYSAI